MNFLWLGDLLEGIYDVVNGVLGGLFYWLSKHIYSWISSLYELFIAISKSRILDNDVIKQLADRIGLLLGILMFFIIMVSMIQMLLDPDKLNDKEKGVGPILIRTLLVIVMFGVSSFVFNSLYKIQNIVIDSGVINNLLLPYTIEITDKYGEEENEKFGNLLAFNLFTAFYNVDSKLLDVDNQEAIECENDMEDLLVGMIEKNDFSAGDRCMSATTEYDGATVSVMNFDGILLLLTGIVVVYFLFTYCISVGIRMIQLMFLEIISPMAFVSYLSPKKDNMFSRWLKIYFSTFIDVFIRIAIISFISFLILVVFNEFSDGVVLWTGSLSGIVGKTQDILKIILIIALLSFGKKAPELIKDLLPATGASKLGFGIGMGGFVGLGALFGGAAALGINTLSKLGSFGRVGKALGWDQTLSNMKNAWNKNSGFKENLSNVGNAYKARNRATWDQWKDAGKAFGGSVGSIYFGGAVAAVRGGAASYSGKNIVSSLKSGQQAQSKANVSAAQRKAQGVTASDRVKGWAKDFVGITDSYAAVDQQLSSASALLESVDGGSSNKTIKEMSVQTQKTVATVKSKADIERAQQEAKVNSKVASKLGYTVEQIEERGQLEKALHFNFGENYKLSDGNYSPDVEAFLVDNGYDEIVKATGGVSGYDNYISDVKIATDKIAADYDMKIKRVEKSMVVAQKNYDDMNEASFLLSMGNTTALDKMVNARDEYGNKVYNITKNEEKGEYYISGVKVKDNPSTKILVERLLKGNPDVEKELRAIARNVNKDKQYIDLNDYMSYEVFDKYKKQLLTKKTEVDNLKKKG